MSAVRPRALEVLVMQAPWARAIEFLLRDRNTGITAAYMVMNEAKPQDGTEIPASFSLSLEEAQALMDRLWTVGLRPSEGAGSAGALAATQAHLEDMRKLTTRLIDKVLA